MSAPDGREPPPPGEGTPQDAAPSTATADIPVVEVLDAGRAVVRTALTEDLAEEGDVTTRATVPADAVGVAEVVAREAGVLAGTWLLAEVYAQLDGRITVELTARDGDDVVVGQRLGSVRGPLRSILTGERTALNLVTHLSGIATMTRRFVDAVAGTGCVVRDTRKTTPGLRLLEKSAVAAGGGVNHRTGLYDGLLVKDNHVEVAGSVAAATRSALAAAEGRNVQIEVDTLEQLRAAIDAGARDLLLDNFSPELTATAVAAVRSRREEVGAVLLESSGTIRLETARAYAATGVDRISVGSITHSAPQLDVALDVRPLDTADARQGA